MVTVKATLRSAPASDSSFERVEALMQRANGFRYEHRRSYAPSTPAATSIRGAGDCKDKVLWLCKQIGGSSVRYVVGRKHLGSSVLHAWVLWENGGQWWALDPTTTTRPLPAERLSSREYIPIFSWNRNGTFRHAAARGYLEHFPVGLAMKAAMREEAASVGWSDEFQAGGDGAAQNGAGARGTLSQVALQLAPGLLDRV